MYPMYGWTDSYPRHGNQMAYGPHRKQSSEAVPPHVSARPPMYEPWAPYGGSYGYSHPNECYGCCNHNYFPGYYGFRPPYPHFPPPMPHHYPGNHPASFFGVGGYPGYQVPPPHYSMEQPRYEYDKGFSRDQHCCGCPNHSCKRAPNENVRIEEQKGDIDKKSSDSVVSSQLRNYPFPFVMVPPGYLMDSEGTKSAKSEGKEDNMINHDSKCDRSSKSLTGPLHEKDTQSQENMQSRFPFPLFWLPYKPDEIEKEEVKEVGPKGKNSGQAVIVPSHEHGDNVKFPSSATGPKMITNDANQMVIPVKKLEQGEEKKNEERKIRGIPVVQVNDNHIPKVQADDNRAKECAGDNAKKRASSPKSSKLPPVCLRVDPPTKAKKVNGSSRSPSPPADKGRSRQSPNESSGSLGQNVRSQIQVDNSKGVEFQKETVNMVKDTTTESKREAQKSDQIPSSYEEASSRLTEQEGINDVGVATERGEAGLECQSSDKAEEAKKDRKMLSASKAAEIIQSVYRGFVVRKSETLQKLRQIAGINQKMMELKTRISALDSCSDAEIDEKQLVAVGETIMSQLLKLDTIQGLHSSVRDMRKSVAKELVNLQEKLDSLTTRKAQAQIVPPSSKTPEDLAVIVADNGSVQCDHNPEEVIVDSTQLTTESDSQSENNPMENELAAGECLEMLKSIAGNDSENNPSEFSPDNSKDQQRPDSCRAMEQVDKNHQILGTGDELAKEENEGSLKLECAVETPILQTEKTDSGEGKGVADIPVSNADESRDEVVRPSTTINVSTKEEEVAEPFILQQGTFDPCESAAKVEVAPVDNPVVEDVEVMVDAATKSISTDVHQLERANGDQDKDKDVAQGLHLGALESQGEEAPDKEDVSEVESDKSIYEEEGEFPTEEAELSILVQEKEAPDDIADSFEEANMTTELIQEKVDEGEIKQVSDTVRIVETLPKEEQLEKADQPQGSFETLDQGKGDNHDERPGQMRTQKVEGDEQEVMEENTRLKEMMEKLIKAGNEQLATITKLSGKINDLEKKLSKNRKLKTKKLRKNKKGDRALV